jgi:hypothetical protein
MLLACDRANFFVLSVLVRRAPKRLLYFCAIQRCNNVKEQRKYNQFVTWPRGCLQQNRSCKLSLSC